MRRVTGKEWVGCFCLIGVASGASLTHAYTLLFLPPAFRKDHDVEYLTWMFIKSRSVDITKQIRFSLSGNEPTCSVDCSSKSSLPEVAYFT